MLPFNPATFLPPKLDPVSAEIAATGAVHLLSGVIIIGSDAHMHMASHLAGPDQAPVLRMMADVFNRRADALERAPAGLILPSSTQRFSGS